MNARNIEPAVYTIPEVARLLAASPWTVYDMIKRDEIPGAFRLGNKLRVRKVVFNRYLGISEGSDRPRQQPAR